MEIRRGDTAELNGRQGPQRRRSRAPRAGGGGRWCRADRPAREVERPRRRRGASRWSGAARRPDADRGRPWARELGIHLLAGSIPERVEGQPKPSTPPSGSAQTGSFTPAIARSTCSTSTWAACPIASRRPRSRRGDRRRGDGSLPGVTLGMTVCYDLRFPELYRILAVRGATVSACRRPSPSRPARTTGRSCSAPARSRARRS